MAFVFKNLNTQNWLAGFRDQSGKRRTRSTGLRNLEKNKRLAERIADEFEATASRKQTALHVRRVISELHKEITGEDLPSTSIQQSLEQWLQSKKSSVSEATFSFYRGVAKKFSLYLGKRASDELTSIVREDVESFRDHLHVKLAPKTVNHQLKALRMFFRDARDRTLIVDDPSEFVKSVKATTTTERRPFSMDEIQKVLAHCDNEWRSMVLFGLYTGQRIGDIARLQWNNIDLKKGVLHLTTGKTGKLLHLPLHPDLLSFLKKQPAPISSEMPIHLECYTTIEREGRVGSLSNRFVRILCKAGLRETKPHRALANGRDGKKQASSLSFHSLRRTAATLLHERGVPQSVAMAFIGHDSTDIHSIYVNVGEEAMRNAAEKIPSLLES